MQHYLFAKINAARTYRGLTLVNTNFSNQVSCALTLFSFCGSALLVFKVFNKNRKLSNFSAV